MGAEPAITNSMEGNHLLELAIRAIGRRNPRKPGDTMTADGILCCGVCGKPKTARMSFSPGNEALVPIACDCIKKRAEAEAQKEMSEKLKQMREYGGISENYTFQAAKQSPAMDKCWKYAENWSRARESNIGLLLWGNVGTGKTFAAHCICNELLRKEKPVRAFVTSLSQILNAGWDKSEIVGHVRNAPLVVFDDLGAERSSEYALENVFMLVDERYRARKPMIVTSNLTLEEMRQSNDMRRQRIYDRILEMCVPIEFNGVSWRGEIRAEKFDFARDVLGF